MDFGNLFSRSWNIVWGNKWMIVIGFLAALGAGASGGNSGSNMNYTFDEATLNPEFAEQAVEMIAAASAAILVLICLGVVIGLVLWILRLTAQAGLIEGAARLDAGEKMGFGDALRAGWSHIWSMVGLNIILFGLLFVISLVVGLAIALSFGASIAAFVAGAESGDLGALAGGLGAGAGFLACCLVCGLAIFYLIASIVYPFAQRAVVLEHMSVTESIGRGWRVIRDNLSNVILLVVFFIIIGFVLGLVVAAVTIPLAFLSAGPMMFGLITEQSISAVQVITLFVGGLFVTILIAAINAIWVAVRSTATTLAYQEFTTKTALE